MPYNLVFIDESESMQRAVATIFLNNPDFKLDLVNEPSFLYKAAKNLIPDIIVLSYNTIDTELKKSITEIKTSKEFSDTPLILLVPSDLSDNERETLIKLKADGFIYRPFDKDAFISKVKRTLSEINAVARTVKNTGNSENPEERIYDISLFETKKTPPSDLALSAHAADPALTELPVSDFEYGISKTDSVPTGDYASANDISANDASADNTPADGNNEKAAESSELNQAFENLFKDDAIFKEFQDINKQEEKEAPAGYFTGEESFEKNEFAAAAEPAQAEGIFNSAEPVQADKSSDIFELNRSGLPEEQPAPVSDEPFAEFNPRQSNNSYELNELGTITNVKTDKSGGELNLKIFDEQNLAKLDDYLKNAIEKTFEEIKPQIIEAIKNSLPEIIEKLVKEEIEKIKRQ